MALQIAKDKRDMVLQSREGNEVKVWLRVPVGAIADGTASMARRIRGQAKELSAKYGKR